MAFSDYSKKQSKKQYVLGIDVGGTKVDPQIFLVEDGKVSERPFLSMEKRTPPARGVEGHAKEIAEIIAAAEQIISERGGELVAVGVGSPGRFGKDGRIKPGTNPNLGNSIGDFDGVNLQWEYLSRLSPEMAHIPLVVGNDADAMLAGMLESIQADTAGGLVDQHGETLGRTSLKEGTYVGLLGLGTGLGHAISRMEKNGFKFVTDGHASKLRVKVDEEDWKMVEHAKYLLNKPDAKPEIVALDDHTVRAEDLMRGPVLNRLIEDGESREKVLRFAGKYLARLIALIQSGQSHDVEPENGWSDEDKKLAVRTSVYLVGGGLGSSPSGKKIIDYARQEMEKIPAVKHIRLVRMPENKLAQENPAARAAAVMAHADMQRGMQRD